MRLPGVIVLAVLLAGPAAAQSDPASTRWSFALGAGALHFSAVARDTLAAPGAAARLRPSGRLGVHLALARRLGPWEAAVEIGWARGHAEAGNTAVSIHDKSADLSRYRVVPSLSRRLAGMGPAEATLALGATMDLWTVEDATRARMGGEIRLAFRVPLGATVAVENSAAVGWSSSPVVREDLDDGFALNGLRTLTFGTGVRIRF
ncbi:MAG: hypothetical protein ACREMX_07770 [Gemmatimonadales bacterium]